MTLLEDTPQDALVVPAARVLLLLVAFSGRWSDGLSVADISRVDFLLRHPPLLARLAVESGRPLEPSLLPTHSEQLIAEHAALHLRYGPWDERYRLVIGRLLALGLVRPSDDLVRFEVTSLARSLAKKLRARGWERVALHATAAARLLGDQDLGPTIERLVAA
ncbi:MAG: hypothetical protein JWR63_1003 [Conexibacter sp.]|nr:hypothetical protein [Conexibacter sp.]